MNMSDVDLLTQPVVTPVHPGVDLDESQTLEFEPRWLVLIHNDDVTPFDYVIGALLQWFLLSEELAEHIAQTAHNDGLAVVVVRPRHEAERLAKMARARARLDGYPLTFSTEQEPG
jgi:ATP-dependent Clp protease adaptor protein ClpS